MVCLGDEGRVVSRGLGSLINSIGTGTTLGDRIEASALRDTFCKDRDQKNLVVGSIKSNIGHTESVAGLAGLIKTVLMLEKGYIPPNPTFVQPSEKLPITDWKIEVRWFPLVLTTFLTDRRCQKV